MILVESHGKVLLGGTATLMEEERELAWAEKFVVPQNKGLAWILGNFVEADNANGNGHIFDLEELRDYGTKTIPYTPINMLHQPRYIVGNLVASELLYPMSAETSAAGDVAHPYVEALGAFYRYYFPDEYNIVKKAHAEGSLFYSMECVPTHVKCSGQDGCGKEFAYEGRVSETYCSHLNEPRAHKLLKSPTFTGAGLIIPPTKPGWKRADITEISSLLEERAEEAEMAYGEIAQAYPHLESRQWEAMMAQLLRSGSEVMVDKKFDTETRKKYAAKGWAMPDGSFPIDDPESLGAAIHLARTPAQRAHVKKRASALGKTNLIPDSWNS